MTKSWLWKEGRKEGKDGRKKGRKEGKRAIKKGRKEGRRTTFILEVSSGKGER
jgi:hypothetical protein